MAEKELGEQSSTPIVAASEQIRSDERIVRRWSPARSSLRARLGMFGSGLAILLVMLTVRAYWGANRADADGPLSKKQAKAPAGAKSKSAKPTKPDEGVQPASATEEEKSSLQIVATVNGQEITRNELASQALRVFGREDLENLVNRQILVQNCKAQNIVITKEDLDVEIDRTARRFNMSTDRFLAMLKEEREVTANQYAKDIVWPMLALRKLARDAEVTPEELRTAYEAKYGPAVKVRLIACNDQKKAKRVLAEAKSQPDKFPALAKRESDDPSASVGGVVPPIHKHFGNDTIEKLAFQLQEGQVSEIVSLGNQYIILKCDQRLPAQKVTLKDVAGELETEIREGKERQASNDAFVEMRKKAKIEMYYGTDKAQQFPGQAAVVNDRKITVRELGEMCIERHGAGVLDGMITRRLLEQACKKRNVTIKQEDLDEEVERAAKAVGMAGPDGRPLSVEEWLKSVTEQQGVTVETYIHDAVWPSVALKKLVGAEVKINDQDLKKGFEANYGPRVRCLAIVVNSQRKAQEVWQKARENNTAENFGQLAEQYSIEESSRLLRGEVPPIQKHGGQPVLEEGAFGLQPGELSSVLQVGDKFVILRCEGYTEPIAVEFAEVKQTIYDDIFEKKLRLTMAKRLESMKKAATIDNFLAGTFQSPEDAKETGIKGGAGSLQTPSLNGGPSTPPRETMRSLPGKTK